MSAVSFMPAQITAPLGESGVKKPTTVHEAATQFEALMINAMLQTIRDSEQDEQSDGEANSSMLELSQQQFAQALASGGGLGIAKMIEAGLQPHANR